MHAFWLCTLKQDLSEPQPIVLKKYIDSVGSAKKPSELVLLKVDFQVVRSEQAKQRAGFILCLESED